MTTKEERVALDRQIKESLDLTRTLTDAGNAVPVEERVVLALTVIARELVYFTDNLEEVGKR